MDYIRHLVVLRLVVLAALVVTAAMTVELVYPNQGFCPLEEACDRVHESELGTIVGVPTPIVGLVALAAFLGVSLLPMRWTRHLLRLVGLLAAVAGLWFVGQQVWVLGIICPLCLVVDAAAIVAGAVAATLPAPPKGRFRSVFGGEATSARVAWLLAAVLAVVTPFAWPRSTASASGQRVDLAGPVLALERERVPGVEEIREEDEGLAVEPTPRSDTRPITPPERDPASPTPSRPEPAPAAPLPSEDETLVTVAPDQPRITRPRADASELPPAVTVVEFLNPYCTFCRATHQRFERVLEDTDAEVRLHRIYAWGGKGYPAWARACAYAAKKGREDALFAELLRSHGQQSSEIYAAARRAGLDSRALRLALLNPVPPSRLVRDRKLVQRAGLQGLPTLDIGTRRLVGEQSEADLRAALDAAAHPDPR